MHCKAFGHIANFDMHSLKQVYIYVVCVELYCLNQFQNICVLLGFQKSEFLSFSFAPKNLIQNLSIFWG